MTRKNPVECGGIYDVTESGIYLRHLPQELSTPKDGDEFLQRFRDGFELNILERPDPQTLVFELINVDVSFANALRRIMIADVPTIAIEHVYMWNNTSVVHDEVLAHRIGLVPLNADPRRFDEMVVGGVGGEEEEEDPTDRNTVVFRLEVGCGANESEEDRRRERARQSDLNRFPHGDSDRVDPEDSTTGREDLDRTAAETVETYRSNRDPSANVNDAVENVEIPGRPYTKHVYSSDLEWVAEGDQGTRFPDGIRPVHEDILLAKLRPGQRIELEAHGRKGYGRDHAKYSPVATASYRLMPRVEILGDGEIRGEKARELVGLYEPGVFRLEKCMGEDGKEDVRAVVHNEYACTMSRNYMRDPELKEKVRITRVPNHFIFTIESVGMLSPASILVESLRVLQDKCRNLVRLLDETLEAEGLRDD